MLSLYVSELSQNGPTISATDVHMNIILNLFSMGAAVSSWLHDKACSWMSGENAAAAVVQVLSSQNVLGYNIQRTEQLLSSSGEKDGKLNKNVFHSGSYLYWSVI